MKRAFLELSQLIFFHLVTMGRLKEMRDASVGNPSELRCHGLRAAVPAGTEARVDWLEDAGSI